MCTKIKLSIFYRIYSLLYALNYHEMWLSILTYRRSTSCCKIQSQLLNVENRSARFSINIHRFRFRLRYQIETKINLKRLKSQDNIHGQDAHLWPEGMQSGFTVRVLNKKTKIHFSTKSFGVNNRPNENITHLKWWMEILALPKVTWRWPINIQGALFHTIKGKFFNFTKD